MDASRLERALTQRIYVLDRDVSDTKVSLRVSSARDPSKTYDVDIMVDKCTCTCPDFIVRGHLMHCKHILCVLVRVFAIPTHDVEHGIVDLATTMVSAVTRLQRREAGSEKIEHAANPYNDTLCPICYEDFDDKTSTVDCDSCHHIFHHTCLCVWLRDHCTCPMCRQHMVLARMALGRLGSDEDQQQWQFI